jgi:hypothetical protein
MRNNMHTGGLAMSPNQKQLQLRFRVLLWSFAAYAGFHTYAPRMLSQDNPIYLSGVHFMINDQPQDKYDIGPALLQYMSQQQARVR